MTTQGQIFKRCGCRDQATRQRLDKTCPRLAERGHGTWYFHCSATNLLGRAERVRRGGYPSQAAASLPHRHTTLRAALNLAAREGIIVDNPARRIEIPAYRKPHPQVWT